MRPGAARIETFFEVDRRLERAVSREWESQAAEPSKLCMFEFSEFAREAYTDRSISGNSWEGYPPEWSQRPTHAGEMEIYPVTESTRKQNLFATAQAGWVSSGARKVAGHADQPSYARLTAARVHATSPAAVLPWDRMRAHARTQAEYDALQPHHRPGRQDGWH